MMGNFLGIILAALLIFITGCRIETPEIKGMVLDADTKEPVVQAWIHARLDITTKTLAGDVQKTLSVDPPHTRTNEKGEFIIPAWHFDPSPFPYGFGTKADHFSVSAETVDDRIGSLDLKEFKGKQSVIILVQPMQKMLKNKDLLYHPAYGLLYGYLFGESYKKGKVEEANYEYLRALFDYCFDGRFFDELPRVKEGCDAWELNYVITKHERFLETIKEPKTTDQEIRYATVMRQLGYLFKRKKDYDSALETFVKVRDFSIKRNLVHFMKQYEKEIKDLQEIIGKKP